MNCPHCNYESTLEEWDSVAGLWTEPVGDEHFFSLPLKLEQTCKWNYRDIARATLYACPKCCKTFIEG